MIKLRRCGHFDKKIKVWDKCLTFFINQGPVSRCVDRALRETLDGLDRFVSAPTLLMRTQPSETGADMPSAPGRKISCLNLR